MGRGPIRHDPRHLAAARRSRTDPREHVAAELALAAVAMVLTVAVVVGSMFERPAPPEPDPPATTARPATTSAPAATPPPAASGPAGWRAIGGARVERAAPAPAGRVAAGFTAVGRGDQGMALTEVLRCAEGRSYAVTVRLRASRPDTVVQVTLLELADGRRLAADTVGAVLADRRWRRVEVTHDAHLPGAALALEIVLPRGSPRATVLVDGLEVVARRMGRQVRFG
jgi:hypothetical protein